MKRMLFVGGMLLATNVMADGARQSEKVGISIEQGGEHLTMAADPDNIIHLTLGTQPFTIGYPNGALNICTWTDESVYEKAKIGTDTMQDFTSCMFVYKSMAMPGDATYFYLSSGGGFSLNSSHGVTKLSDKRSIYKVTHFERQGKGTKTVQFGEVGGAVYIVAWMDNNKNQVIDKAELERFKLEFK